MKLAGEFDIPQPPEETYRRLTDLEFVLARLDDVEIVERKGDDTTIRAVVGVSHIRGALVGTARWEELEPSRRAKLAVAGGGISSRVEVQIAFEIDAASGDGSVVRWTADAAVAGRLSSIGAGLIEPIAQMNADRLIDSLRVELGGDEEAGDTTSSGRAPAASTARTPPAVAIVAASVGVVVLGIAVAWWRRRRSRSGGSHGAVS
jgi:carbon monoxide dehydrogenase subunit G